MFRLPEGLWFGHSAPGPEKGRIHHERLPVGCSHLPGFHKDMIFKAPYSNPIGAGEGLYGTVALAGVRFIIPIIVKRRHREFVKKGAENLRGFTIPNAERSAQISKPVSQLA
jgi:hypothetical protein